MLKVNYQMSFPAGNRKAAQGTEEMGPCYRKKSIRDVEIENKRILMRYYDIRCNALGSCSHAPLLLLGCLYGVHGSNFTHFRLLSVLSYASCKCIEVWTQRTLSQEDVCPTRPRTMLRK